MIPDEKLRKRERILKTGDFRNVYTKGRWQRDGATFLYFAPNGLAANRIGFSIGSRHVKLASSRNRIKRLFKEVFRRRKSFMKKGHDLVIVVKKDFGKAVAYGSVDQLLSGLLKKAGLL